MTSWFIPRRGTPDRGARDLEEGEAFRKVIQVRVLVARGVISGAPCQLEGILVDQAKIEVVMQ